jgi:Protein of unknown function (DUF2917)
MIIFLSKNELISIIGDTQGVSFRCNEGVVWVTQPNDQKDHFISSGEEFTVSRLGTVIVEAHTAAEIVFSKRVGASGMIVFKDLNFQVPPSL